MSKHSFDNSSLKWTAFYFVAGPDLLGRIKRTTGEGEGVEGRD
jgi:hypothetical protein